MVTTRSKDYADPLSIDQMLRDAMSSLHLGICVDVVMIISQHFHKAYKVEYAISTKSLYFQFETIDLEGYE